MGGDNITPYFY